MSIEKEVKDWLEKNPGCPESIKEWLTRPADKMPYVTEKNKRDYMASHAFVKALVNELKKPHEITEVSSIQEAIDTTRKDIWKKAN